MRPQKMLAELRRETFGNLRQRNAAGIGGKNGIRFAHRIHFAPQLALELQILDHRFENPIALSHAVQVILEIAGLNQRDLVVGEKSAGRCLDAFSMPLRAAAFRLAWPGTTISRSSAGTPALAK